MTPLYPLSVALDGLNQVEHNATNLPRLYKSLGINPAEAGAGIKVGIIDSGIAVYNGFNDVKTNPCFTDAGYPKTLQLGDTRYTNNKVIVAKAFTNSLSSEALPVDGAEPISPKAVMGHGSHVAGIIGCNANTKANLSGVKVGSISGIAPKVQFGSYNIFPDGLQGDTVYQDIANAIDSAVADGMQIINMSLGGSLGDGEEAIYNALDRAEKAGVLVIVASGNDGPDSVGTPGNWNTVVTVGSVSGGRVLDTILKVGNTNYTMTNQGVDTIMVPTSAKLTLTGVGSKRKSLTDACDISSVGSQVKNRIAVVTRGDCDIDKDVSNLINKGAVGVVVVLPSNASVKDSANYVSNITTTPTITIPNSESNQISSQALAGTYASFSPLTLEPAKQTNQVSYFSSGGVAPVSGLVKPDILAPGENVISASTPGLGTCADPFCFQMMSGTSMATPYIVGVASILKQAHPDWSLDMLRSAIIHTASTKALSGDTASDNYLTGLGLVNPYLANKATYGIVETSALILGWAGNSVKVTLVNPGDKVEKVFPNCDSTYCSLSSSKVVIPPHSNAELTIMVKPDGLPSNVNTFQVSFTDGASNLRLLVRYQGVQPIPSGQDSQATIVTSVSHK